MKSKKRNSLPFDLVDCELQIIYKGQVISQGHITELSFNPDTPNRTQITVSGDMLYLNDPT